MRHRARRRLGITVGKLVLGLALLFTTSALCCVDGASGAINLAWVRVAVATVWYSPSSPQPIDASVLRDPPRLQGWLSSLTVADRLALDSRITTQVLLGDEVVVLARRQGWSEVEVPDQRGSKYPRGILGWVPSVQLSSIAPVAGATDRIVAVPRAWLYRVVNGRLGRRWFLLSYDTQLPVIGTLSGYLIVSLPGGDKGAIASSALGQVPEGTVSGSAVARQAHLFLGLAYLWGGTSGFGYDCSGLVYALYARFGIYLPRDAADQQHAGTRVALSKLRPGDLLFFAGQDGKGPAFHVAIYVGGGRVIDSPFSGASVELVPMRSLPVWSDFAGAIQVTGVASQ